MIEINSDNARFLFQKKDYHIVFVNSPFCGTCKVARRMLDYIEDTLEKEKFYELNATLAPDLMQEYKIQSVPCLIVFKDGEPVERMYTFHSVPYVLKEMGPYLI
ncbi:thioredoxin family protein [Tenuibacillus multivorans]|uniref:Thioredoxin n=1 Tax=Tenuibacillus multivorans TaxID=237069 RepID=A0A1H0DAZ6_9BACI|nr:thioredoxin family protein [Tenuibacillus multivorans]GEL76634.1 thiol reductase thioredoxin [Tenuibacillus multivorans]SDN67116.1 Thioredoxin [Tenuibacillus multivorans]